MGSDVCSFISREWRRVGVTATGTDGESNSKADFSGDTKQRETLHPDAAGEDEQRTRKEGSVTQSAPGEAECGNLRTG